FFMKRLAILVCLLLASSSLGWAAVCPRNVNLFYTTTFHQITDTPGNFLAQATLVLPCGTYIVQANVGTGEGCTIESSAALPLFGPDTVSAAGYPVNSTYFATAEGYSPAWTIVTSTSPINH